MNGQNHPVGFQGINIQQPGGQQQFIPNPYQQQPLPGVDQIQQQLSQLQQMQHQLKQMQQPQQPAQQSVYQQPAPNQSQANQQQTKPAFELPVLGILERLHNLLSEYGNKNEKAYPIDLRNQAALEINKLRMFQERMGRIPIDAEQSMQQMFSKNIMPFLERQ